VLKNNKNKTFNILIPINCPLESKNNMMDLRMTESNLLVGRTKSSHDICKKRSCQKVHFADISIRPVAEDGRNQRSGQKATRASFYWQGLLRHLTFLTSRRVCLLFVKWSGPSIFSFLIFLVCIS